MISTIIVHYNKLLQTTTSLTEGIRPCHNINTRHQFHRAMCTQTGGHLSQFKAQKAITCGAQHKYYANIIMVKPYNCYDDLNVIN